MLQEAAGPGRQDAAISAEFASSSQHEKCQTKTAIHPAAAAAQTDIDRKSKISKSQVTGSPLQLI